MPNDVLSILADVDLQCSWDDLSSRVYIPLGFPLLIVVFDIKTTLHPHKSHFP